MKTIIGILMSGIVLIASPAFAQKIDEARMERDIEVAENILKTLVRQQFDQQRMFFGFEVEGSYQEGFGVTFRFPADFTTPIAFNMSGIGGEVVWVDEMPRGYTYSVTTREDREAQQKAKEELDRVRLKAKAARSTEINPDSIRQVYNEKLISAAKDFLVDYGDLISQLSPTEKIVITNRGDQPRIWVNQFFTSPKRSHLSVEITKGDITSHKQGKL